MTSKEQERAVLVKIKKIVADLGQDSYLGSAFDGAFELAENNIEDDAAYSAQYYIDRCNALDGGCTKEERDALKSESAAWRQRYEQLHAMEGYKQGKLDEFEAYNQSLIEELQQVESMRDAAIDGMKQRDGEIMALKAKLYDLITASEWEGETH